MWWRRFKSILAELLPRLILGAIFLQTENMTPFYRYIQLDELWLYRYPRRDPYVTGVSLWCIVLGVPFVISLAHFIFKRDKDDFIQVILAVSISLGINCAITNMVKLIIGRPRPDFFWRCFPDGEMNSEMQCTGKLEDVIEGRKSFPSGHSSISFSSLGMMGWWMMGKLHVWSTCKGSSGRLVITLLPFILALTVALSRICDYHHHWQDVTVGSLLGLTISYMCYRQHFPPLSSQYSHRSYSSNYQSISTIQKRDNYGATNECFSYKASSREQLTDDLGEDTDFASDCKQDNISKKTGLLPIKPPVKWI